MIRSRFRISTRSILRFALHICERGIQFVTLESTRRLYIATRRLLSDKDEADQQQGRSVVSNLKYFFRSSASPTSHPSRDPTTLLLSRFDYSTRLLCEALRVNNLERFRGSTNSSHHQLWVLGKPALASLAINSTLASLRTGRERKAFRLFRERLGSWPTIGRVR